MTPEGDWLWNISTDSIANEDLPARDPQVCRTFAYISSVFHLSPYSVSRVLISDGDRISVQMRRKLPEVEPAEFTIEFGHRTAGGDQIVMETPPTAHNGPYGWVCFRPDATGPVIRSAETQFADGFPIAVDDQSLFFAKSIAFYRIDFTDLKRLILLFDANERPKRVP